jgi:hypothetical protein
VNASRHTRLDIISAIGLAAGGAFGLAGTFVAQPAVRQVLWAIDAVGLIVATALLTLKYFRKGDDCVAAGFLVFVGGEALAGWSSEETPTTATQRLHRTRGMLADKPAAESDSTGRKENGGHDA